MAEYAGQSRHIEDIETDKVQLSVFECLCGFHVGLDFTFIDQVCPQIIITCPACNSIINANT